MTRRAIVVRGGWDGHVPVAATEEFLPFLRAHDFAVRVSDSLEIYADAAAMAAADLIVQCWSMGELTPGQCAGLVGAVRAGTGLAGWHGGIVGTFRTSLDYLRLVGGQFLAHPRDFTEHRIDVVRDHPIVAGFGRIELRTEQYWVLADDKNEVLATTTLAPDPDGGWTEPVTVPAVWTRNWGAGRVFVCTAGHDLPALRVPAIGEIIRRGLRWAARPANPR